VMLDKIFTVADLKSEVLSNLSSASEIRDTDFMWKVNTLHRKKSVKKNDILKLVEQIVEHTTM